MCVCVRVCGVQDTIVVNILVFHNITNVNDICLFVGFCRFVVSNNAWVAMI